MALVLQATTKTTAAGIIAAAAAAAAAALSVVRAQYKNVPFFLVMLN